jgi:hypothetical protein
MENDYIKMKYIFTCILFFVLLSVWSQGGYNDPDTWTKKEDKADSTKDERVNYYSEKPFYIGLGLGMDFGGLGGKLEYMFLDYGGLFGGVGYNFDGVGANAGIILKPVVKEKATPYFLAMFGYNGIVVIQNAENLNRTSFGLTIGAGLEIKTKSLNAWQIGLLYPFRSEKFLDHYEDLKNNPNIELGNLPRFGFSLGFKILI